MGTGLAGDPVEAITVLLVDDHEIVRRGVRAYFETQAGLEVVAEAGSGEAAVELAADVVPDVALVDLLMPGIGGVEAIRQIKRHSPRTQVVALTSYHEDEHIFPALRAGALSYVLKDVPATELVETVRRAARGESVLHPRVAARVVRALRADRREKPNVFVELSDRELEVLRLIAAGLANAAIADRLFISEKTVKGHVSNILGKLHILDRTQAAVLAWEEGLVRRERGGPERRNEGGTAMVRLAPLRRLESSPQARRSILYRYSSTPMRWRGDDSSIPGYDRDTCRGAAGGGLSGRRAAAQEPSRDPRP